jgi:transposase-like protein
MQQIETSRENVNSVLRQSRRRPCVWTAEDTARAVELFHAGVKSAEAAKTLGCSHYALLRFWRQNGLQRNRHNWPSRDEMACMCRQGLSINEIAARIGKHRSHVWKYYKRLGIKPIDPRKRSRDAEVACVPSCVASWQSRFVRPEDRRHGR